MSARLASAAVALAAALLATGCGEREAALAPERVERLEVRVEAPHAGQAGVYAARERGHFRAAGLAVRVVRSGDPLAEVASGRADLALVAEPDVLRARDRGHGVVSVGALVDRPLSAVVSLPAAGIRGRGDLRGRTFAARDRPLAAAFVATAVGNAGNPSFAELDPVDALLVRKADAIADAHLNREALDPRLARRRAAALPVDELGVPPFAGAVVAAREDALEEQGGAIRGFLGAVARGTRDLDGRRAGEQAVRALATDDRSLPAAAHRRGLERTLPLLATPRGRSFGYQDPRARRAFLDWMLDHEGLLERRPSGRHYTNDLLPGSGLP